MSLIEGRFNHDFTISRPGRTANGSGGWATGYVDAGEFRGFLDPVGAAERTSAQQIQAKVTHVLYCLATVDIRRGDLVTGAGQVVKVLDVGDPGHLGHHLEVDCMEVQKEAEQEAGS